MYTRVLILTHVVNLFKLLASIVFSFSLDLNSSSLQHFNEEFLTVPR